MARKIHPQKRSTSKRAKSNRTRPTRAGRSRKKKRGCPIVGVGGSAGGFEAAMELLKNLSPDTGMAFVIVQHLDPHHASRLPKLLARVTSMPVTEISGEIQPKPNQIYVQPANKCVVCRDGVLTLVRRSEKVSHTIDHFFESLAETQGPRAIGVILSGSGMDGTNGLRAIKSGGGLTFAQDEETAKYNTMPQSAIQAGFVDAALSPAEIARELKRIAEHPYIQQSEDAAEEWEKEQGLDDLQRIFLTLKKHTAVDFTFYKEATINRRIRRRMALHRLERMDQYSRFLRDNPKEIQELFGDLLINVTRFFRDDRVFGVLKKRFIPALLKQKDRKGELRVWVPGCATGEEVYSLAICILESLGNAAAAMRIHIFGTDLSEAAINRARLGVYSTSIEKDVSSQRLQRFFRKLDSTYQVSRMVREICTFARQNITADPPFSHLDLISCRNVLIYLGGQLQRRCLPIFHYALNPGGFLMLGPSETVGPFTDMFELVDKQAKIYAKKILLGRRELDLQPYLPPKLKVLPPPQTTGDSEPGDFNSQVQKVADRIMLGAYAPAGVVIDSNMNVRQFRGKTGPFLEHSPGPASLNLLHIVRTALVPDLRTAIHRAAKTGCPVRKERATLKHNSELLEITIEVVPFKAPASDATWFLIVFDKALSVKPIGKIKKNGRLRHGEVEQLREELSATKESLQAIIEEQEATNEELKSANEEIESSNEELQSTNEELETAKEELQSTNEELTTLNEELSNRNIEMIQINSDLNNLLSSIQIPIVMVDGSLTVRRATPTAAQFFNIRETDIGRRLTELNPSVRIPDLESLLRDVIETLAIREKKIRDEAGRQFLLRVRPYRTADNKIDGAVLTVLDLTDKQAQTTKRKKEK
ncbi:MAG TPA: chemotaxis protein CheB [Chthoniobacterales bacterium]|jgi:two-component system CheB/CheR fusion protein|nr:chemotaxis protein CheB [Chthoniobacterales bacterium]